MNSLVAIDPIDSKGRTFTHFCEAISYYQKAGFFSKLKVASIIHPSLYAVPFQFYREMADQYAHEAHENVKKACEKKFEHTGIKILRSTSAVSEELVSQLTRFGRKTSCELLILSSNNRSGLAHWILGSFSETAALTSCMPVLVIKPQWKTGFFSKAPRILVAVDASAPPSKKALNWISKFSRHARTEVDLVYVEPRHRLVFDTIQSRKTKSEAVLALQNIQGTLKKDGVQVKSHYLEENKSLAHTLAGFAEETGSWIIVTVATKRALPHRLLLGSAARRLLGITERPFLTLRLEA